MRLLLINPRAPESFWTFRWAVDEILPRKRAVNPPLGLATLAALAPASWEVEIVDENVEAVPREPKADIIGICGMGVQFPRQRELLEDYRGRGYYVVAGGSFASLCPEQYAEIADTVVAGEAEYIWPRFCADFEAGAPKAQDEELMRLLREANFQWVFIGIESPDPESLKETKKYQNTREDMLDSLRRIYANAIDVFAGFIVGFDHDSVETFERQRQFITQSGIQVA